MGHGFESTVRGHPGFQFTYDALAYRFNPAAMGANQMMLMGITARFQQSITRRAFAEVKPLHQAQSFQHLHGAINRR